VIAWLYAIGSIFRLAQNPHFLMALSEHRFARSVRRIQQPFFIVCGFGDTGSLLARGLSDHWLRGVIIDTDPERIKALRLRDYHLDMPGLCADPTVPKHLIDAGVRMPNCRGLVILTVNEEINARISTMTRLLNPGLHILCRSSSKQHIEHLNSLGNITIINPFEIFAQLLSMAITAPRLHNLNSCLVRSPGIKLGQPIAVPTGNWIICGYGRMGRWMYRYFVQHGINPVIIDPQADKIEGAARIINDHANRASLQAAGIEQAAGVVAGTDSDRSRQSRYFNERGGIESRRIYHCAPEQPRQPDRLRRDRGQPGAAIQPDYGKAGTQAPDLAAGTDFHRLPARTGRRYLSADGGSIEIADRRKSAPSMAGSFAYGTSLGGYGTPATGITAVVGRTQTRSAQPRGFAALHAVIDRTPRAADYAAAG